MIAKGKRDDENEDCRKRPDFNNDSCHFRTRAPTLRPSRSCLFRQGSRCSLRHALARENFPPPREMRLTSRHRPMLLAVSASPEQPTSQPASQPTNHPPLPSADSKQIFYRRENNPSAFPTKTCKPSPTKLFF